MCVFVCVFVCACVCVCVFFEGFAGADVCVGMYVRDYVCL